MVQIKNKQVNILNAYYSTFEYSVVNGSSTTDVTAAITAASVTGVGGGNLSTKTVGIITDLSQIVKLRKKTTKKSFTDGAGNLIYARVEQIGPTIYLRYKAMSGGIEAPATILESTTVEAIFPEVVNVNNMNGLSPILHEAGFGFDAGSSAIPATPDLEDVLAQGNTTGSNDIVLSSGAKISGAGGATIDTLIATGVATFDSGIVLSDGYITDAAALQLNNQAFKPGLSSPSSGFIWVNGSNQLVYTDSTDIDYSFFNQDLQTTLSNGNDTNGNDVVVTTGDSLTVGSIMIHEDTATPNPNTVVFESGFGSLLFNPSSITQVGTGGSLTINADDGLNLNGSNIGSLGNVNIFGGDTTSGSIAGNVSLSAGDWGGAAFGTAGQVYVIAGDSTVEGNGGFVVIEAGNAATATAASKTAASKTAASNIGGSVNINAGDSTGSTTGGAVIINSGSSVDGYSGNIVLQTPQTNSSDLQAGDINFNIGNTTVVTIGNVLNPAPLTVREDGYFYKDITLDGYLIFSDESDVTLYKDGYNFNVEMDNASSGNLSLISRNSLDTSSAGSGGDINLYAGAGWILDPSTNGNVNIYSAGDILCSFTTEILRFYPGQINGDIVIKMDEDSTADLGLFGSFNSGGNGGSVSINGGQSTSDTGGAINISSGSGTTNGDINLIAGTSSATNSGSINLVIPNVAGTSGALNFIGGDGSYGTNISINCGDGSVTNGGGLVLNAGDGYTYGGGIALYGGEGTTSSGGSLTLSAGDANAVGQNAGGVFISAGENTITGTGRPAINLIGPSNTTAGAIYMSSDSSTYLTIDENGVLFNEIAAASIPTPTTGGYVFVDSADGALKFKNKSGNVYTLATNP